MNARDNNDIAALVRRIAALESQTRHLSSHPRAFVPRQDSLVMELTQTTHGFSVNNVIEWEHPNGWVKAYSDGRRYESNAPSRTGPLAIVIQVIDANTFVAQFSGWLDHTGWSSIAYPGRQMYLHGATAGALTLSQTSFVVTQGNLFRPEPAQNRIIIPSLSGNTLTASINHYPRGLRWDVSVFGKYLDGANQHVSVGTIYAAMTARTSSRYAVVMSAISGKINFDKVVSGSYLANSTSFGVSQQEKPVSSTDILDDGTPTIISSYGGSPLQFDIKLAINATTATLEVAPNTNASADIYLAGVCAVW